MAVVPSRQFYPTTIFLDSFQSSLAKLHFRGTLNFLRYGSSNCTWKHKPYAVNYNRNSDKGSQRNSNFVVKSKKCKLGFSQPNPSLNLSSDSWLVRWNESQDHKRLKPPQAVMNYRNNEDLEDDDRGSSTGSTMERIVEKLKKFGYVDDLNENKDKLAHKVIEKGSVEDIFHVEEGMLPNARGGFSPESPLGMETNLLDSDGKVRFPWEKTDLIDKEMNSVKRKSRTSLAELTLPESELRRLRILTLKTKSKIRIGGSGVSQEVVDRIKDKWKTEEIVRLKMEGPPALNMRRTHEILEKKTGGIVVWRSGTAVSLYRGLAFEVPPKRTYNKNEIPHRWSSRSRDSTDQNSPLPVEEKERRLPIQQQEEEDYDEEVDKLLEGLGPRYTDWPGSGPAPVDADLLPGIVPGFEPSFRILPYGIRSTLAGKEATSLRRLARVLPPHFALGRSRQHQGLAAAMFKLWQTSSIAKIALKRGVQLTTSERMAEDIKKLTGGILLSRNKDFLVFYRGKSFLTPVVAEALLEKERLAKSLQEEEEMARIRASSLVTPAVPITSSYGTAGTLGETLDANARWGKKLDGRDEKKIMREAKLVRHAGLVRKLEKKLRIANRRLSRGERALAKVEAFLDPSDRVADQESITDEERFMFRKLGLKMKAFLLLGRRGVFDGTVENMHLHWKYRELVKIVVKAKTFDAVKKVALSLEAESGGVLVSVDKISKGYAIIVYRGNDYQRPSLLRPKNLLTKRKALSRSIELQRREALMNHVANLITRAQQLRRELDNMASVEERGDEELYDKLESAYADEDDEDNEEEGDDSYLGTYDDNEDEEEVGDADEDSVTNFGNLETNFPYDFQDQEDSESEKIISVSD